MTRLVDVIARTLAHPTTHRHKLRLLGAVLTGAIPAAAGNGARRVAEAYQPRTVAQEEEFSTEDIVAVLRKAYADRDGLTYRLEAFRAILMLRTLDTAELSALLLELLADIEANGAEGVETLFLTLADGLAVRGDVIARQQALSAIVAATPRIFFASSSTPPNLRVPVGRVSSFLVLDVRADAVRTMMESFVFLSQNTSDLQSLMDMLDATQTRQSLCDLEPLPDQTGNVTEPDAVRQENCSAGGSAGRPGSGTVSEALGGFVTTACMLMTMTEMDRLSSRIGAMERCFANRGAGHPLAGAKATASAPAASTSFGTALGRGVAVSIIVNYGKWLLGKLYDIYEQREYNKALTEASAAMDEWVEAAKETAAAEDEVAKGWDQLNEAEEEIIAAEAERDNAGTDEERAAAVKRLEDARKAYDKAAQNLQDAMRRHEDAIKREAEAEKEARDARDAAENKRPEQDLSPDDPFSSESCAEAMGDPTNRLIALKLIQDWDEWNAGLGRRPHAIDPSPDALQPYDALRLPACGADGPTLSGEPAAPCNVPIMCLEGSPDENCGCSSTSTDAEEFAASVAVMACIDALCPDGGEGTAQGHVCVCGDPNDEDFGLPVGPEPPVLAAVFGNGGAAMEIETSPSFSVVQTLFSEFDQRQPD